MLLDKGSPLNRDGKSRVPLDKKVLWVTTAYGVIGG